MVQRLGELHALRDDGFRLAPQHGSQALSQRDFAAGEYPGLPWFLDDLRPQGFLGRTAVQETPLKLLDTAGILAYLLERGDDLPGDLVLGDVSMQRALAVLRSLPDAFRRDQRDARYPVLAAASTRGECFGSTVGGAQPKFAITLIGDDGPEPVIVKFSDQTCSPAGRRWADLLICEHHAGVTLREHGFAAALTDLIEVDQRVFLQSTRFDRTRDPGRRGLVSLAALDAAYYGHGRIDWWRFAPQLQRDGWLTSNDARTLSVCSWFGILIANADMHLGNASLHLADDRPLALSPCYDMLPMRFRPSAGGQIVERRYEIAMPAPDQQAHWHDAAVIALDFWQRVAGDQRISRRFRAIADEACVTVQRALAHRSE